MIAARCSAVAQIGALSSGIFDHCSYWEVLSSAQLIDSATIARLSSSVAFPRYAGVKVKHVPASCSQRIISSRKASLIFSGLRLQ